MYKPIVIDRLFLFSKWTDYYRTKKSIPSRRCFHISLN